MRRGGGQTRLPLQTLARQLLVLGAGDKVLLASGSQDKYVRIWGLQEGPASDATPDFTSRVARWNSSRTGTARWHQHPPQGRNENSQNRLVGVAAGLLVFQTLASNEPLNSKRLSLNKDLRQPHLPSALLRPPHLSTLEP